MLVALLKRVMLSHPEQEALCYNRFRECRADNCIGQTFHTHMLSGGPRPSSDCCKAPGWLWQ